MVTGVQTCALPIYRALKRYKRKYDKTGIVKQLRSRQQFIKPSVILRQGKLRAAHKQRLLSKEEQA